MPRRQRAALSGRVELEVADLESARSRCGHGSGEQVRFEPHLADLRGPWPAVENPDYPADRPGVGAQTAGRPGCMPEEQPQQAVRQREQQPRTDAQGHGHEPGQSAGGHPGIVAPKPLYGPAMEIVDLSAPIVNSPEGTPEALKTAVEFSDHAEGAALIEQMFGIGPELLRDGEGWAVDFFTRFGTHNSTHVDAPWHYNSKIDGRPAETIDQLPLEWFFQPGVKLDFAGREDGEAVTAGDIEGALDAIGHELEPLEIVLIQTGCDRWIDTAEYMTHGPGVTGSATEWLYGHGIRVMGIDAWGWDRPLWMQAEEAKASGEPGTFWQAHQVGLSYSQIERMVNLDRLPADGFTVSCLPLPLLGGSAAPARVVAILDD